MCTHIRPSAEAPRYPGHQSPRRVGWFAGGRAEPWQTRLYTKTHPGNPPKPDPEQHCSRRPSFSSLELRLPKKQSLQSSSLCSLAAKLRYSYGYGSAMYSWALHYPTLHSRTAPDQGPRAAPKARPRPIRVRVSAVQRAARLSSTQAPARTRRSEKAGDRRGHRTETCRRCLTEAAVAKAVRPPARKFNCRARG